MILADAHGYTIERRGDALVFRSRRPRPVGAWVLIGLGAAGAMNGSAQAALGAPAVGAGLWFLGGLFLWLGLRELRRARGYLSEQLAPTGATCHARIDWTDGMGGFRLARVLEIRWPGGRRRVYKTYDKKELARVRALLHQHGIR